MPQFAHLPLLLKPDGNGKLSKRDGDRLGFPVFPLEWKDPKTGDLSTGYREAGYDPEAVINFLALLGWHAGSDQELFSMQELIDQFSLERCSKSGAKFDFEKAKWFNHQYLQQKSMDVLVKEFQLVLRSKGVVVDDAIVAEVVALMRERVSFTKELWDTTSYFFVAPVSYDEKSIQKRWKPDTPQQLAGLMILIDEMENFTSDKVAAEAQTMAWIAEKGYKVGDVMNAYRIALVGESKGPHIFDLTSIIGKDETLRRVRKAIETIS